jgi:hypothetical protein
VFEVCGHAGSAALEIGRWGQMVDSDLLVPLVDVFRRLWPTSDGAFEWPPQGGYLNTRSLHAVAHF